MMDSNITLLETLFIKKKGEYPTCENCGYVWIEEMLGVGETAHSNTEDLNYCPKCGRKVKYIRNEG